MDKIQLTADELSLAELAVEHLAEMGGDLSTMEPRERGFLERLVALSKKLHIMGLEMKAKNEGECGQWEFYTSMAKHLREKHNLG
ncbi:MAG TPA: hypothetical protein VNX28_16160 [Gemmataceae bacterium]|jgi:hypothetical protein|nr:hypothetical protein [Gemmataceae bacterium]